MKYLILLAFFLSKLSYAHNLVCDDKEVVWNYNDLNDLSIKYSNILKFENNYVFHYQNSEMLEISARILGVVFEDGKGIEVVAHKSKYSKNKEFRTCEKKPEFYSFNDETNSESAEYLKVLIEVCEKSKEVYVVRTNYTARLYKLSQNQEILEHWKADYTFSNCKLIK